MRLRRQRKGAHRRRQQFAIAIDDIGARYGSDSRSARLCKRIAGKRQLDRASAQQQQHRENTERQNAHAIARGRRFAGDRRLRH